MLHGILASAIVLTGLLSADRVRAEEAKPSHAATAPQPTGGSSAAGTNAPLEKSEAPAVSAIPEAPADAKPAPAPAAEPAESKSPALPIPSEPAMKEDVPKPAVKAAKPAACVAPLEDLVKFHEREVSSMRKNIDRWNNKLQAHLDRLAQIEADVDSLSKELEAKKEADPKRNKKEISRLGKQIERLRKDARGVAKELSAQCSELAGEVKEMGKESAAVLRERYQQAQREIEGK